MRVVIVSVIAGIISNYHMPTMHNKKCNRENLRRIAREARNKYYGEIEPNYTCIYEGDTLSMNLWPNPSDSAKTSHGVLHKITGCMLRKEGFSLACATIANFGYEAITFKDENPTSRSDRNWGDYLIDTKNDIMDVFGGYMCSNKNSKCGEEFVPSECKKK